MGHLGLWSLSCHRRMGRRKRRREKGRGRRKGGEAKAKAKSSALKSNNPTLKGWGNPLTNPSN